MVDADQYFKTIRELFSFLATEFNMVEKDTTINGNAYYAINFADKSKIISVSLENIANYFTVIVFKLEKGKMPDYDDKNYTLHLHHLNKLTGVKATKEDYQLNNAYFSKFSAKTPFERQALKAAKDIRLCLTLLTHL